MKYASAGRCLSRSVTWWVCCAYSGMLLGCAPSPPIRAALREDLPTLRAEILAAELRGKLDRDAVVDLAEAVAQREVASAHGPSGAQRVHGLRACSRPLLDALRELSKRKDEAGAEAWLLRIQQGDFEREELLPYAAADSPAFRAVAARVHSRKEDGPTRRRLFLDPDQRIRRAALEAAYAAKDPADLELLLETFRLDPDSLSRSWAARAAGAIGGEAAVLGLKDRYERADEVSKLAILEAWSTPSSFKAGGERELARVADQGSGLPALTATHALIQAGSRDGALQTRLRLALERGTSDEKRLAILFADVGHGPSLTALRAAAQDLDSGVQLAALRRLTELPAHRAEAITKLRGIAGGASAEALEARVLLATLGDQSVVPGLLKDLEHGPSSVRARIALTLFGLGREARSARALADVDPDVRVSVACGILSSAGSSGAAPQAAAKPKGGTGTAPRTSAKKRR